MPQVPWPSATRTSFLPLPRFVGATWFPLFSLERTLRPETPRSISACLVHPVCLVRRSIDRRGHPPPPNRSAVPAKSEEKVAGRPVRRGCSGTDGWTEELATPDEHDARGRDEPPAAVPQEHTEERASRNYDSTSCSIRLLRLRSAAYCSSVRGSSLRCRRCLSSATPNPANFLFRR